MRAWLLPMLAVLAAGCGIGKAKRAAADSAAAATRVGRLTDQVGDPRGRTDVPLAKWIMPRDMQEISGIVLAPDGNHVLAHGDERAHLVEIDWRSGMVIKRFNLGETPVKGDFEGITRGGLDYYMLTSKGKIYQFREVEDGKSADYVVIDTKLGDACEFEGIAHDPLTNSLLMACKTPEKSMRDSLVIYRWPLGDNPPPVSRITIALDLVIASNDWDDVRPSDITIDPFTGNIVLITAQQRALIVLSRDGQVVSAGPVPTDIPHTEGIAITRDGLLLISAEAGDAPASITIFRWPHPGRQAAAPAAGVQDSVTDPSQP
ncbi:MAG: SdiA-regulated domain-containing protein [Gemmatimonadales bacterium]|nr:SdiA-regulated domain-containing protein [Gemmatimonadales bacterium]